ncbi:Regulating synaptic membrane exocytosis protein 4 [Liparis tanakae]|uniref:Regulating synaptic membrane exocytosis protein 4 n=1 Tax=Liparis tanakae TaxID=230148 RepID=A0A4Z2DYT8_9TELE|nr:Regulating synaptic membrane exocytosis protein 4 [Liparis tanakae]
MWFPPSGDVEIGLLERNGVLEVEVVQARGLTIKPGSKGPPATYIKVYLLENGSCVAKKKTKSVRKSLDPLYSQVLVFSHSPQGKVVQVRPIVFPQGAHCVPSGGSLCSLRGLIVLPQ